MVYVTSLLETGRTAMRKEAFRINGFDMMEPSRPDEDDRYAHCYYLKRPEETRASHTGCIEKRDNARAYNIKPIKVSPMKMG